MSKIRQDVGFMEVRLEVRTASHMPPISNNMPRLPMQPGEMHRTIQKEYKYSESRVIMSHS